MPRIQPDYRRLKESGETPGRALTPEESLRLFTTAASNDDWMVAYCAAIIANDTGMRGVELKTLRLADIDIESRKLTILRSKTDRGIRNVILTNDALKAVLTLLNRAQLLNATESGHYLFPYKLRNCAGYDVTQPMKSWRKAWRALTKAAGLAGFRFHDLRHTFITNHAEIGTPLPVVMAQAGHLSRRMTELYTHISQRAMQEAAERYQLRKAAAEAEAKRKLDQTRAEDPAPSAVN